MPIFLASALPLPTRSLPPIPSLFFPPSSSPSSVAVQESEEELELLARRPLALDRTRVHPSIYHLAFRCVADALEDESAHFDEARQASMTEVMCAPAGVWEGACCHDTVWVVG